MHELCIIGLSSTYFQLFHIISTIRDDFPFFCCCSFYTIVASENIRPYSNYSISVSIHDFTEPTTLKLSIQDDDEIIAEDDVVFMSSGTEVIRLAVGDISVNNNFRFVAEGLAGLVFRNETTLNVESKNCSIFIQTDKSIYKPSDTIRLRILVLDFDLRPYQLDDDGFLKIAISVNIVAYECTGQFRYEHSTHCSESNEGVHFKIV